MTYINGFIAPVKHEKKDAYLAMATKAAPLFKEYGALEVVEGWGNDLPRGKTTDFFMAVKAEDGENVIFSWIIWPSKAVAEAAWEKIMADPRMQPDGEMPFDGKRMFWGGFDAILDTQAR